MSRTTADEFNRTAEVIRNLSNGVDGMTSAFSFRVLNLFQNGEVNTEQVDKVLRPTDDASTFHRDIVITMDFGGNADLEGVIEKVSSLQGDAQEGGNVIAYEFHSNQVKNKEVTVPPDEGADQD